MPSIQDFISYARIQPLTPETDGSIRICLDAAVQHARDAGIPDFLFDGGGDPKLNLYVYALALHYYDNRGFMPQSQAYASDEYTKRLMRQMRVELMYRQTETETEGTADNG